MDGGDTAPTPDVIGHVLADADSAVHSAQSCGVWLAGEGAVGTKWRRQRGARQVDHARAFGFERGFEQQLRRVVGGRQDYIRTERGNLVGEIGAELRMIGRDMDLDPV